MGAETSDMTKSAIKQNRIVYFVRRSTRVYEDDLTRLKKSAECLRALRSVMPFRDPMFKQVTGKTVVEFTRLYT